MSTPTIPLPLAEPPLATVLLSWYCGCYVGPARWHPGNDSFEPRDCDCSFTAEATLEEWEERDCATECPACGADLHQADGHATLLPARPAQVPI